MGDEKEKKVTTKIYGGAGNPNRLTSLRNDLENRVMTFSDGSRNPTKVIALRNNMDSHVAIYNPVTKKITLDGMEVNQNDKAE